MTRGEDDRRSRGMARNESLASVRSQSRHSSISRSRARVARASISSSSSRRASSRRGSVVSHESILNEENNHEMYAGAGSEIIPSSITSFHYPHSFGGSKGARPSEVSLSRETSPLLQGVADARGRGRYNDDTTEDQEEMYDLHSLRSNLSAGSNEDQAKFKFFKLEEIELAPGGSTYENPEEPVDYNTDWQYPNNKYDEDMDPLATFDGMANDRTSYRHRRESYQSSRNKSRHRRMSSSNTVEEFEDQISYGSSNFETRRRSSTESDDSRHELLFEEEESVSDEQFNSQAEYQRYYLAEEDIVIGIAGYQNNIFKLIAYYLLCILTLGMGYLILRWLPRYRINLIGDKVPLGKATWCIIENEYGELTIVDIDRTKFNERLSAFLNIDSDGDRHTEHGLPNEVKREVHDPVISHIHSFTYRYLRFYYNPVEDIFKTNNNWYDKNWLSGSKITDGLSQAMVEDRTMIFGLNSIEIDDKPYTALLLEEVLHPFYIFQIFSVLLWLIDDYYYYASCILIISLISIINTLIETKSTMQKLKEMSMFTCEIRVWRNEFWKTIALDELAPGDIFEVDPSLLVVPCDCVLLNGETIVNESMLTGESVPITKSQIDITNKSQLEFMGDNINLNLSRSYLYNGTKLLKKKSWNDEPVKALVIKTGFNTTKGSLIRSMLFPRPVGFKFYQDSFKYIGFMTGIAVVGFTYSMINFVKLNLPRSVMILRALDIITIVVPPALPATLTIGTTFAVNRLRHHQIYCISPTRVNVGGKLDVICFDKTGTLTEDGLDVLGVHVVNNIVGRKQMEFKPLMNTVHEILPQTQPDPHSDNGPLLVGLMSTCHSLRQIDDELMGDPLDLKMFNFTESNLKDEDSDHGSVAIIENSHYGNYKILKEFEFDSNLRRMSCLVENNSYQLVFVKGAPEMIMDISNRDSLPDDYLEMLYNYTNNGYRVIACGYKVVNKRKAKTELMREEAESELNFLGFIIFENKLKLETTPTIKELRNADIRTVMCTGDNILTAISVGRQCGILKEDERIYVPRFNDNESIDELVWEDIGDYKNKLDSRTLIPLVSDTDSDYGYDYNFDMKNYKFAITGEFFKYLLTNFKDYEMINRLLIKCEIFARMSPDEKHELVNQLQKLDYTVGFIGDGANDCGALKGANVGVSLSEAEASIAAPFTSRIFEISCLLTVIREGRSSLVTSFASFKFMSLYSAIQFITITILYQRGTNLGDFQFLYIDLIIILPLAIFMSWSKPHPQLIKKRPTANLVSARILMSLILNILLLLIFQVILWLKIQQEPWYTPPKPSNDDDVNSYDNTLLFLFSNFQYIIISLLLTEGPPYRQKIHQNKPYLLNVVIIVVLSLMLCFTNADSPLGMLFQLVNLPLSYYWLMLGMMIMNYVTMFLMQNYGYDYLHCWLKKLKGTRPSKKLYKNLMRQYNKDLTVIE